MSGYSKAHTASDKRHGDPEYGGLTSGQKAALTRGQDVKLDTEDLREGAERYLADKEKEKSAGKGNHTKSHK